MNRGRELKLQDTQDGLLTLAKEEGAVDAVRFTLDDIVFDARSLLKCMFGCRDWGRGLTCPSRPGSLKPWEYEQLFRRYHWGIIIHGHTKKTTQDVSYILERQAFFLGYYFAFSLSDCALCAICAGYDGKECRNPEKARPAFHSVGIDVFATVRGLGMPIETLVESNEEQNWYSAVFVE